MEDFELLFTACLPALERFVRYKIGNREDAEDLIQEIVVAALQKRDSLRDPASMKPWLLSIARNKCTDYYRAKARRMEIPIGELRETSLTTGLYGRGEHQAVSDTLERLGDKEKQILYLYYFKDLPQDQIAERLGLPLGTVKSRLYYAKRKFRETYPQRADKKGGNEMKKLPEIMPEYTIVPSRVPPFPVRWEEIMGWFIVPKLGEKCSWAMYDFPEKKRTELCELEAVSRAAVHGIEGVEIRSLETDPMACNSAGGQNPVERRLIAQLTDSHCRLLAHEVTENGVKTLSTFLDGEDFNVNWGFGENNCGNEVEIVPKGDIVREGSAIRTACKSFLLDVVGRYTVTVNGKSYDTVCVMDVNTYDVGMASEQFLDKNGRTVLWRRFNRDDWAIERYKKPWSELLPRNERLTVNGETYVHWYDCITDYIL